MKQIILSTDLSEESLFAVKAFVRLQKAFIEQDSEIILLAVLATDFSFGLTLDGTLADSATVVAGLEKEARARLEEIRTSHLAGLPVRTELILSPEKIHVALLDFVTKLSDPILVIATHGRHGFRRFVLGSVTERILAENKVPVLAVPCQELPSEQVGLVQRILVTTDLSPTSERAFPFAHRLFQGLGSSAAHMTALHILEDPTRATFHFGLLDRSESVREDAVKLAEAALDTLVKKYFPGSIVDQQVWFTDEPAHKALLSYLTGHRPDLLVLASHGKGSFEHMVLGSLVQKIVRSIPVPLLVVPVRG